MCWLVRICRGCVKRDCQSSHLFQESQCVGDGGTELIQVDIQEFVD